MEQRTQIVSSQNANVHGLGSQQPSNSGSARQYIQGAGAISIAFLLDLLKLNTLMKDDMATLSAETTQCQSAAITVAATSQKEMYDAQAGELEMQMMSTVASAITSGLQGGMSFGSGFGTKGPAAEASEGQSQMEQFNEISTTTDLNQSDGQEGSTTGNYENPHEANSQEDLDVQALREQLTGGRFNVKSFGGKSLDEATVKIGDNETSVLEAIKGATPEERATIGEKFAESRDAASKRLSDAIGKWSNQSQALNALGTMANMSVDSFSKGFQADYKRTEGEKQSDTQMAQGTQTILGNAQKTISDGQASGSQNIGNIYQTIVSLVASDVHG